MAIAENERQQTQLSSDRLLLRGAVKGDAAGLHVAFSDPRVMAYWSTLPHTQLADTETWVSKMQASTVNGVTDFIICLNPDLTPIGKIGVWQGNEIGFMLAQPYWGKGIAREAMDLILSYLFAKKHFDEITADVEPRNVASVGLLKRTGFVVYDFKEKNYLYAEEWQDSVYLKLTKEAWELQRSPQ